MKSISPAAAEIIPAVTTGRTPNRATSRGAREDPVNTDSVIGKNEKPACSASSRSTCWRYSVMKKNMENKAAYIKITTRFAARRRESLKMLSGTSGASATRPSTSRNAAIRTSAAASGPRTPGEPQPSVSVRTMP